MSFDYRGRRDDKAFEECGFIFAFAILPSIILFTHASV